MIPGDLSSPEVLERAAAGCDVVFHCAYGAQGTDAERRVVNVQGTERVLAAALAAGCRRVVHVSTMSVYGDPQTGDIDETATRRYTGSAYGDSKIDAENTALAYCDKGLSVTIVQPTVVYGPFGLTWTIKPLQQLQTGRVIMVNGGDGVCNPVYIDDVVSAMIAAASSEAAHRQAFLISGDRPVTWREFFQRYERMIAASATISMTPEEARAHFASCEPKGFVADTVRVLRREGQKRETLIRERLSPTRAGRLALEIAERCALLPERAHRLRATTARRSILCRRRRSRCSRRRRGSRLKKRRGCSATARRSIWIAGWLSPKNGRGGPGSHENGSKGSKRTL